MREALHLYAKDEHSHSDNCNDVPYSIEYALEMDSNQLDVIGGVFIAFKWNTNDSTHIVCCRLFSYCIGMV